MFVRAVSKRVLAVAPSLLSVAVKPVRFLSISENPARSQQQKINQNNSNVVVSNNDAEAAREIGEEEQARLAELKEIADRLPKKMEAAALGDMIQFTYINRLDDGTEIDTVEESLPIMARLGDDQLLDSMTQGFVGKRPGEVFHIKASPEDRGDEYSEEKIQEMVLPRDLVEDLQLTTGEYGWLPSGLFAQEGEEDEEVSEDFLNSPPMRVKILEMKEYERSEAEKLEDAQAIQSDDEEGEQEFLAVTMDFNSEHHDKNYNFEVKLLRNFGDVQSDNTDVEALFNAQGHFDDMYSGEEFGDENEDYESLDEEEEEEEMKPQRNQKNAGGKKNSKRN